MYFEDKDVAREEPSRTQAQKTVDYMMRNNSTTFATKPAANQLWGERHKLDKLPHAMELKSDLNDAVIVAF